MIPAAPFAGDTGQPDPALVAALAAVDARTPESAVVEALAGARVFAAVVPHPDSGSDLAVMTVSVADGRRALPVFTGPDTLSGWRTDARPVPVSGPHAAQAAVAEACDLLAIDLAGPLPHVVRRPAVWALAHGRTWTPSYSNPVVTQEISRLAELLGWAARCERGDTAELRIVLSLPPGRDAAAVNAVVARMSDALAGSQVVADLVDSVELRIQPL